MTDPVLADLFDAMDIVVLERLRDGPLYLFGAAPAWFTNLYGVTAGDRPVELAEAFPFLDAFLDEAATFWWKNSPGRLRSGPSAVTDRSGGEYLIEVSAVSVDQRRFLLIELLTGFDAARRVLQTAREKALEHERLVKSTRALVNPMKEVIGSVEALLAADLTETQRALVERIRVASARVMGGLAS